MKKIKVWGIRWGSPVCLISKSAVETGETYKLDVSDVAFYWKTEINKSENLAFGSRAMALNHAVEVSEKVLGVALDNYRNRKFQLKQVRRMADEEH